MHLFFSQILPPEAAYVAIPRTADLPIPGSAAERGLDGPRCGTPLPPVR